MTVRHFLMNLRRACGARAGLAAAAMALGLAGPAGAQVVISQVSGGGGNAGGTAALYPNDYIELKNNGVSAVSVAGWSVQYASAGGSTWAVTALSGTIAAGGYYLVQVGPTGTAPRVMPTPDVIRTPTSDMSLTAGKVALMNNTTAISATCPSVGAIVDFVAWGSSASDCNSSGSATAPTSGSNASAVFRTDVCTDTNTNSSDFSVATANPRNSATVPKPCPSQCGPGIALTTSPTALWQQFSLACTPQAFSDTVQSVLGGAVIGRLDTDTYGTRWSIWKRNAANNGNVQMALADTMAPDTGYWIKSLDAPVGGGVLIPSNVTATAAPVTTSSTCITAATCAVLTVPTGTAGTRMIAHPLPYDVDWSRVRVWSNHTGSFATYTLAQVQTAGVLSNQFWIYNGTSYSTWSSVAPNIGNLRYASSFFVRVLANGVGKTIELRIPTLGSRLVPPAADTPAAAMMATSATSAARQSADSPTRGAWLVDLSVRNPEAGWSAAAKLGQWPGALASRDDTDLAALPPFAQPNLTLVFPHPEWRSAGGDYAADLRPANGFADKWDFEVRAQPGGINVVLRWNAPDRVLAKSRLIDRDTGLVVYPTDPNYADGYPITLDTPVRRLTWEYLGN